MNAFVNEINTDSLYALNAVVKEREKGIILCPKGATVF